eukprot:5152357-Ditylum_brightwellii.AAC.1
MQFQEGPFDIDSPVVDKYTKEFLTKLQQTLEDPPVIDTSIKPRDIKQNYKNWKEDTNTSPSGCYLSLYKMWINIPEEKDDEYQRITSNAFLKLITNIMCTAAQLAYPLKR